METHRQLMHPKDAFKLFGLELPEYITVNVGLTKRNGAQYDIIRQTTHDGTLVFEKELIGNIIKNLYEKSSYCNKESLEGVKDMRYEIGMLSLATIFGIVNLPIGKYPGQKTRARLPVKCILIR